MKLEVLISCMNQKDFSILDKINVHSDILIVNQCNENSYKEKKINGYLCRMINTTQRGLSQSRNECLNNMRGDIGIICDDDIIYYDNYSETILKAFKEIKDADIIIFDMDFITTDDEIKISEEIKNTIKITPNVKIKKSPRYKYYISSTIAFKKGSFQKKNIWFNLNFGTGSGKYSNGEESLIIRESKRRGLKVFEFFSIIGVQDHRMINSTWFKGYDEKYFYDKGALVKALYPHLYFIFKYYYIVKLYKKTELSIITILKNINNGIKGYKNNLSYEEFKVGENK